VGGGGGIVGGGLFSSTISGAAPFAGSLGGAGTGGDVKITSTHNVVVSGDNSVGIYGQSAGGSGQGNVSIKVDNSGNGVGLIWAFKGNGAAVEFADGKSNTLITNGTLYAQGTIAGTIPVALNGMAILGGSGDEAITNLARSPSGANAPQLVNGTRTSNIIGNVDLGGGNNTIDNQAGALFITYDFVKLSATNPPTAFGTQQLTNSGFLSPGDRGGVKVTSVAGNFQQTGTGVYYIDVDLNKQNTPNPVTDRLNVTGSSKVGGEGPLLLLSINKAFANSGYVVVHSDGGTTNDGFTPTLT